MIEEEEDRYLAVRGLMHRLEFIPGTSPDSEDYFGLVTLNGTHSAWLSREDTEALRRWCDSMLNEEA